MLDYESIYLFGVSKVIAVGKRSLRHSGMITDQLVRYVRIKMRFIEEWVEKLNSKGWL